MLALFPGLHGLECVPSCCENNPRGYVNKTEMMSLPLPARPFTIHPCPLPSSYSAGSSSACSILWQFLPSSHHMWSGSSSHCHPSHPAALLLTLDKPISPTRQLWQSQTGMHVSQAADGSSAVLSGLQLGELLSKSSGLCLSSLFSVPAQPIPAPLKAGCTRRLLTCMTAAVTPPQAVRLGSGKGMLICCTVIIHIAMVLSIPRQGSGPFLRGLRKLSEHQSCFFVKRISADEVEMWKEGRKLSVFPSPWSQQSRYLGPWGRLEPPSPQPGEAL